MALRPYIALIILVIALYGDARAQNLFESGPPAVADFNGKLSIEGGFIDDDGAGIGLGSVTFPLGHAFGLQLDGAAGYRQKGGMYGGALHLFFRNPDRLLLGGYASYHDWRSDSVWRLSGEYEFYLDRFSLEGLVGLEGVEGVRTDEHFFSVADLVFFATDDLRVLAGHRYVSKAHIGVLGLEYLFGHYQDKSVSLFVDARYGERDYEKIVAGLRVYFGGDTGATLKYRHRNLDPRNRYPDLFSDDTPGGCPAGTSPFMGSCVVPE